jgi:hypothetical protein
MLTAILHRDGCAEPEARAESIATDVDAAWRLADRSFLYRQRQRRATGGEDFANAWSMHQTRFYVVMDRFERSRRRDGTPIAATRAAMRWDSELRPTGQTFRQKRAVQWTERIADALIEELEAGLRHGLRFSRTLAGSASGPTIRVLVAFCEIAIKEGISPARLDLVRGKGVRRPGSAQWFSNKIRKRRAAPVARQPL